MLSNVFGFHGSGIGFMKSALIVSRKGYILDFVVAVQLIKGAVKDRFLKCNLSTLSAVVQLIFVFIFKFLIILTLAVMIIGLTRCRCL